MPLIMITYFLPLLTMKFKGGSRELDGHRLIEIMEIILQYQLDLEYATVLAKAATITK